MVKIKTNTLKNKISKPITKIQPGQPVIKKQTIKSKLRSAKRSPVIPKKLEILPTKSELGENPIARITQVYLQNEYNKEKAENDYKFITAVDYYHDGIKGDRLTTEQKKLNEELLDKYLWSSNEEKNNEFQSRDVNISDLERKTQTYFERVLSKSLDASKKSGRASNTLQIGKIFDKNGKLLLNLNDKIFDENHITIEYNSNTNPRSITDNTKQKKFYDGLKQIFNRIVGKGQDISDKDILINVDAKYDPIVFAMFSDSKNVKQVITPANSLDSGFVSTGFDDITKTIYNSKDNFIQVSNYLTSKNNYEFIVKNNKFSKDKQTGYKWGLQKSKTLLNEIEPTTKQINGPSIQTLSSYIECSTKNKADILKKCYDTVIKNNVSQIPLTPFLLKVNDRDIVNKLCFDIKHMGDFEQVNYVYSYARENKDKIYVNLTGDINCATYSDLLQSFVTILSTPNSIHISVGKPIEIISKLDKQKLILRNNFKELSVTLEMNKVLINIKTALDGKTGDLYILYNSIISNIEKWGNEDTTPENKLLQLLIKLKALDIAFTINTMQNIVYSNELYLSINKTLKELYGEFINNDGSFDFNKIDMSFSKLKESDLELLIEYNNYISKYLELIRNSNKNIQYLFELFYKTNSYDTIKSKKFKYEIKPNSFFLDNDKYLSKLPQFDFDIEDIKYIIRELSVLSKYKNPLKCNHADAIEKYLSKFMIFKMYNIGFLQGMDILEGYTVRKYNITDSKIYKDILSSVSDTKSNIFEKINNHISTLNGNLLSTYFKKIGGNQLLLTPTSSPKNNTQNSNVTISITNANKLSSNYNDNFDKIINPVIGGKIIEEFKRSIEQIYVIFYYMFTNRDDDTPDPEFSSEILPPKKPLFSSRLDIAMHGGDGSMEVENDLYVNEEYESIFNTIYLELSKIEFTNLYKLINNQIAFIKLTRVNTYIMNEVINEFDMNAEYIIATLKMYSQDTTSIEEDIQKLRELLVKEIPKILKKPMRKKSLTIRKGLKNTLDTFIKKLEPGTSVYKKVVKYKKEMNTKKRMISNARNLTIKRAKRAEEKRKLASKPKL